MSTDKRLLKEEYKKRKQELAAQEGTYVVRGLSIESRVLIRYLNEYDWSMIFIKRHIGRPNINQEKALSLIERCTKFESEFKNLVKDLTSFVKECRSAPRVSVPASSEKKSATTTGDNKPLSSSGNGAPTVPV